MLAVKGHNDQSISVFTLSAGDRAQVWAAQLNEKDAQSLSLGQTKFETKYPLESEKLLNK